MTLQTWKKFLAGTVSRLAYYYLPSVCAVGILWLIAITVLPIELDDRFAFLVNYKYVLGFLFSVLTLWFASLTLKKHIDVETVRLLKELREYLNQGEKRKIHFYLLDDRSDKMAIISDLEKDENYVANLNKRTIAFKDKIDHSNIEIFDYLGTIELGYIMLKRGVIDEEEFQNQFGYRVENIRRNKELMTHIFINGEYYKDLLQLLMKK